MVNRFLKSRGRSKRQSTRMRKKIEKKVRDHNKKKKRLEKKKPNKKKRKDPGVPNSLPFKEQVLKEAEDRKLQKQKEQEQLKEKRKREREKLLNKKRSLDSMVKDALKKQKEFEKKKSQPKEVVYQSKKSVENSLKTFYKEFKKVVDKADVVLEVLDARDPIGSRCMEVEQSILSGGTNKKLVLVLNKIDLVPKENVQAWLKHLRNEFPAVAFKASTQRQNENLARSKVKLATITDDVLKSNSNCLGADVLMKLLGNYCRNQGIKTSIRVGVVGFPNTGKSSIINSLKRSKVCNVGATPGVTRSMQEIQLDKHIQLLDSPGVVMAHPSSSTDTVLRNVVKVEAVEDPIEPVEAILKRCSKEQMMLHYGLPSYKTSNEFLALLAKRRGKLKKGGVPDMEKAARSVLLDWTVGKITYYTHPPEQVSLPSYVSAELVTEFSKAFSLDDIQEEEEKIMQTLRGKTSSHMLVKSSGPVKCVADDTDLEAENDEEMEELEEDESGSGDDEDMEESDGSEAEENVEVLRKSSKASPTKTGRQAMMEKERKSAEPSDVVQLNKQRMKDFKKMKKQRKRDGKVADSLSDALTSTVTFGKSTDEDGDYNFETDFR